MNTSEGLDPSNRTTHVTVSVTVGMVAVQNVTVTVGGVIVGTVAVQKVTVITLTVGIVTVAVAGGRAGGEMVTGGKVGGVTVTVTVELLAISMR